MQAPPSNRRPTTSHHRPPPPSSINTDKGRSGRSQGLVRANVTLSYGRGTASFPRPTMPSTQPSLATRPMMPSPPPLAARQPRSMMPPPSPLVARRPRAMIPPPPPSADHRSRPMMPPPPTQQFAIVPREAMVIPPPREAIDENQGVADDRYDASRKRELTIVYDAQNQVKGLHPHKSARKPRAIFEEMIDVGAISWNKVTKYTKNFYFAEFAKQYKWRKSENAEFRAAWEKISNRLYSNWVYTVKKEIWKKGEDMPYCFTQLAWDSFVEHWLDPKQQEISERNAKNRRCGSEDLEAPAPASHTGGSKPHHVHVEDKANLSGGVFPKHIDMYIALHKQKDTGDDHYNSRVNGIITEFNRRKEEDEALAGSINIDETPHLPIDENKLFVDAIGPPRKGRWCGSETQTSLTPIGGFPTQATLVSVSQSSEDRIYERVITTVKETLFQIEANKVSTICEDATGRNNDTANYDDEEWIGTDDETMMDDGVDMAMENNNEINENGAKEVESTIGVDDNQFFVNLMADNPLLQNN